MTTQPDSPLAHYDALLSREQLQPDTHQRAVIERLDGLYHTLRKRQKKSVLACWMPPAFIHGVYLWGDVGRGKSMCMDMFFSSLPMVKKRRVHFHQFMQEIHHALHEKRHQPEGMRVHRDHFQAVLKDLLVDIDVLCFDELQATDVTDASLIHRLFRALFEAGVVVVSTSNRPPAELYTGQVQAERFDKLTELLNQKMQVLSLNGPTDYRTRQLKSLKQTYYAGLDEGAKAFVHDVIVSMAPHETAHSQSCTVNGRHFSITSYGESLGVCSFDQLCATALGAADYLTLAENYVVFILTDIPQLGPEHRNEAKRFVTLIDVFYEHKIKLICTAEVSPGELYVEGSGSFEFERTVSRLNEMQSEAYLERRVIHDQAVHDDEL